MQQIHIKQVHYPSGIVRNFANGSKISAFTRQWILDHTANKSAVSINKRPSGVVEHGYTIEISDADIQALAAISNQQFMRRCYPIISSVCEGVLKCQSCLNSRRL